MAFPHRNQGGQERGGLKNPASGNPNYQNPGAAGEPTGAAAHGSGIVRGATKPPVTQADMSEPESMNPTHMQDIEQEKQPSHPSIKSGPTTFEPETIGARNKNPYGGA